MNSISKSAAIKFVVFIGLVSCFADMTYEGARSIAGQYLATLGASGAVVGTVAGAGELIGYGFRLVSGYYADRTRKYWPVAFTGYAINLFAVPMIGLMKFWPLAALLLLIERFGKAIRIPSRDAMLSFASHTTGRGWGFGLHESLDKTGGLIGPLFISGILWYGGSYQMGFLVLLFPALCAMAMLSLAWFLYPNPQHLEIPTPDLNPSEISKRFWTYVAGTCCVAAGYVDFPLIAYHYQQLGSIPPAWIPALYAIAMGAAGLSALLFGRLYDRFGMPVLIALTALSSLFVLLVFTAGFYSALAGLILWGMGIGVQNSIMRAVIPGLVHINKRSTAYGLMNICFGIYWFFGSMLMGWFYDISLTLLIIFSLLAQWLAIPLLLRVNRMV